MRQQAFKATHPSIRERMEMDAPFDEALILGVYLPPEPFEKTRIKATDANINHLVATEIKRWGLLASLNHIDVSEVVRMSQLFSITRFKGDISRWDVSSVESMDGMFNQSDFNGDISQWDVSNVRVMCYAFQSSQFVGDISLWDVAWVEDMAGMFQNSKFSGDLSGWKISGVKVADGMFAGSPHAYVHELTNQGMALKDAIRATSPIVGKRVTMGIPLALAVHGLNTSADIETFALPTDME